jgi:small-conductance mechanosensitive channel
MAREKVTMKDELQSGMNRIKSIKNINIADMKKISFKDMNRFIILLGVIFLIVFTIRYVDKTELIHLSEPVYKITSGIITIVSFYFVASLFIRITLAVLLKFIKHREIEQKLLLTKMYGFIIYIITTILVLSILGVTVQNITLVIGMMATGLAFALREILLNYMVWFMFLTKRPFRIGDHIKIGASEGKVQHIGGFYVILDDSPEDISDFIRVPNRMFLENPIINYGKAPFSFSFVYPLFRDVKIKDVNTAESKIKELKNDIDFVIISDDLSVKIEVSCKVESYQERDELKTKILKILIEHLPFKS